MHRIGAGPSAAMGSLLEYASGLGIPLDLSEGPDYSRVTDPAGDGVDLVFVDLDLRPSEASAQGRLADFRTAARRRRDIQFVAILAPPELSQASLRSVWEATAAEVLTPEALSPPQCRALLDLPAVRRYARGLRDSPLRDSGGVGVAVIDRQFVHHHQSRFDREVFRKRPLSALLPLQRRLGAAPDRRSELAQWSIRRNELVESYVLVGGDVGSSQPRVLEVRTQPVAVGPDNQPTAALQVSRDVSAEVMLRIQEADLESPTELHAVLSALLEKSLPGFRRARIYRLSPARTHLVSAGRLGDHEDVPTEYEIPIREDRYTQATRRMKPDSHIYSGTEHQLDDVSLRFKHAGQPWLEVPIRFPSDRSDANGFLGKICCDQGDGELPADTRSKESVVRLARFLAPAFQRSMVRRVEEERSAAEAMFGRLQKSLTIAESVEDQLRDALPVISDILDQPLDVHIRLIHDDEAVFVAPLQWTRNVRAELKLSHPTSLAMQLLRLKIKSRKWTARDSQRRPVGNYSETHAEVPAAATAAWCVGPTERPIAVLVVSEDDVDYFDGARDERLNRVVRCLEEEIARGAAERRAWCEGNAVSSSASEFAIVEASGKVRWANDAWNRRVGDAVTLSGSELQFALTARCSRDPNVFHHEIESVFQGKQHQTRFVSFFLVGSSHVVMEVRAKRLPSGRFSESAVLIEIQRPSVISLVDGAIDRLYGSGGDPMFEFLDKVRAETNASRVAFHELNDPFDPAAGGISRLASPRPKPGTTATTHTIGCAESFRHWLDRDGFVAIGNVESDPRLKRADRTELLETHHLRALIAIPLRRGTEPWALLIVGFEKPENIGLRQVELVRATAPRFGTRFNVGQQRHLLDLSRRLSESIDESAARPVVGNALKLFFDGMKKILPGCQGGHVRVANWQKSRLEYLGGNSPYARGPGRNAYRAEIAYGEPIAGLVAKSREEYIVRNTTADPFWKDISSRLSDVDRESKELRRYVTGERSTACFPIMSDDELMGTLSFSAVSTGYFTEGRCEIIRGACDRLAPILRALAQRERYDSVHHSMVEGVKQCRTEADLWAAAATIAAEAVLAKDVVVSRVDTDARVYRMAHAMPGRREVAIENLKDGLPASDQEGCGLTRYVASTGIRERLSRVDLAQHPHRYAISPAIHGQFFDEPQAESVMVHPLETPAGERIGVLKAEDRIGRPADRGFSEFDESLVRSISWFFALAIDSERRKQQSLLARGFRAHEFRTPVSSVATGLGKTEKHLEELRQSIAVGGAEPERLLEFVSCAQDATAVATTAVRQMKHRVDTALLATKQRIDPDELNLTEFDLRACAEECLALIREQLKDEGWHVMIEPETGTLPVFGDPSFVEQVIMNLLNNAHEHGAMRARGAQNELEITLSRLGSQVEIRVGDCGPGVDPEEDIFALGGSASGTGLGLYVVEQISSAFRGVVKPTPRQDGRRGTEFIFSWSEDSLRNSHRAVKAQGE